MLNVYMYESFIQTVSLGLVDILSIFSSHENSFHHTLITYIFEKSVP